MIDKELEGACEDVYIYARSRYMGGFIRRIFVPFAWLAWHLHGKRAWRRRMRELMGDGGSSFMRTEKVGMILPNADTRSIHDESVGKVVLPPKPDVDDRGMN